MILVFIMQNLSFEESKKINYIHDIAESYPLKAIIAERGHGRFQQRRCNVAGRAGRSRRGTEDLMHLRNLSIQQCLLHDDYPSNFLFHLNKIQSSGPTNFKAIFLVKIDDR